MTIVITGSCSTLVFLATDRRMTKRKSSKSSKNSDDTNKAFIIDRGNACLTIGWTGLAEMSKRLTSLITIDDWLISVLQKAEVADLPVGQTIDLIAGQASKDFELSFNILEQSGYEGFHEFVCAGWCYDGNGHPFAGVFAITNFRDENWHPLKHRLPEFRVLYKETYTSTYRETAATVFISGGGAGAVSEEEKLDLIKLLQSKPSNKAVAGRVGAIIRKVSKNQTLGVSEESRGWILRPDERVVEAFEWPQVKGDQVFGQIIDTPLDLPGLTIGGVWVARGELGKIFKNNRHIVNVFYVLDFNKVPIEGKIECAYLECVKSLERMFRLQETFTLQLEDGKKLNLVIKEIETINHQKGFKVVAKGNFLVDL